MLAQSQQSVPLLMQVLAVWGAITGSVAVLWDVYKWKTAGPKLRMTVTPNMIMVTPGIGVQRTGPYGGRNISVDVTNVGNARTTLKSLTVACYSSTFQRWLKRPAKNFVVVNTGDFCKNLPCQLDVGDVWKPLLPQDNLMRDINPEHQVYIQVWHSASRKPACARLIIPARTTDEGNNN